VGEVDGIVRVLSEKKVLAIIRKSALGKKRGGWFSARERRKGDVARWRGGRDFPTAGCEMTRSIEKGKATQIRTASTSAAVNGVSLVLTEGRKNKQAVEGSPTNRLTEKKEDPKGVHFIFWLTASSIKSQTEE